MIGTFRPAWKTWLSARNHSPAEPHETTLINQENCGHFPTLASSLNPLQTAQLARSDYQFCQAWRFFAFRRFCGRPIPSLHYLPPIQPSKPVTAETGIGSKSRRRSMAAHCKLAFVRMAGFSLCVMVAIDVLSACAQAPADKGSLWQSVPSTMP